MGIESVSVHLKCTKLVTVRLFSLLFHKEEKKKVCFMIFIWKNIDCGLHVQMGIDLHRKNQWDPRKHRS